MRPKYAATEAGQCGGGKSTKGGKKGLSCRLLNTYSRSLRWSFYFGRKPTFSMADYWRRNSMFKLSEIIKKSDVEKLEMLKKKLKK